MPSDSRVIYVVNDHMANDAASSEDVHCRLDDEGTVICQFDRIQAALAATAGDPALRLVRYEDLNSTEQRQVEQALLQ
ncbi:hypothetical protein [Salinibacter altiplanensis]|uniref:hypothetical protein n=1 Tax=Salinibacter altiplanensis TaxID=1803181 RepID=UPI000C9F5924|nr:hypothetical protein [Salinibacter altiplanensis]